MIQSPSDALSILFNTYSPATDIPQDADTLPTAVAYKNATGIDATFTLTVANLATGRYLCTGTIPAGYVEGDAINIVASSIVNGVATEKNIHEAYVRDIEGEANSALVANHLDHLLAVDTGASLPGVSGSILQDLLEDNAGTWRYTAAALAQGPSETGASAATIADAVWDELLAGHVIADSAGLTLAALQSSSGAGSVAVTLNIKDGADVAQADTEVWVSTDASGATVVAGTLETNVNGDVTFQLDPGTYYRWAQKTGKNFTNPQTFTVV